MATIQLRKCDRCGYEARSESQKDCFEGFSNLSLQLDVEERITRHFCAGCIVVVGGEFKKEPRDIAREMARKA